MNYNFNPIFLFSKNKNYLIRLRVFLTFFEVIINFLNSSSGSGSGNGGDCGSGRSSSGVRTEHVILVDIILYPAT